eukprot:GGOE01037328.1.p1 GENE.GGOE01037328.1~~GGOE01037328.1.p1  ORF type:complete len:524 (+),score=134.05 GGOE01037328.1:34-1572(+)
MAGLGCITAIHLLQLSLGDIDAAYSAAVIDRDVCQQHFSTRTARLQYLQGLLQCVLPVLAETSKAITEVQRDHLEEVRNLRSPPAAVQRTLNMVHALLCCNPHTSSQMATTDAGCPTGKRGQYQRSSHPPGSRAPPQALRLRSAVLGGSVGPLGIGGTGDDVEEQPANPKPHSWPELRRILVMTLVTDVLTFDSQWLANRPDVLTYLLEVHLNAPQAQEPADLLPVLEDSAALQKHLECRRDQRARQPGSGRNRSSDALPASTASDASSVPSGLPGRSVSSSGEPQTLTFATVCYANHTCGLLFKWAVNQIQLALLLVSHGPVLQETASIEAELKALQRRDTEHSLLLGRLRRQKVAVQQELGRLLLEEAEASVWGFLSDAHHVGGDELRGRAALQHECMAEIDDLRLLLRGAFPGPRLEFINERLEFATGQAELTPAHLRLLADLAQRLMACPEARVVVQGHFSWNEDPAVAQCRACAVRSHLVQQGVRPDCLQEMVQNDAAGRLVRFVVM